MTKKRQGPTPADCFIEVPVKRELLVLPFLPELEILINHFLYANIVRSRYFRHYPSVDFHYFFLRCLPNSILREITMLFIRDQRHVSLAPIRTENVCEIIKYNHAFTRSFP